MRNLAQRHKEALVSVLFSLLIAGFTFLRSFQAGVGGWSALSVWLDFPTGGDALGHAAKVRYMSTRWPDFDWCNIWYAGTPLFLVYGPLPEFLATLLAIITHSSGAFALVFVYVASVTVTNIAIYASAMKLTANKHVALISGFLATSSSNLWQWGAGGGMYPKVIALSVFSLCLYFLVSFLTEQIHLKARSKTAYFMCELTLSLSILSHIHIAVMSVAASTILTVMLTKGWKRRAFALGEVLTPGILATIWWWMPLLSFVSGNPSVLRILAITPSAGIYDYVRLHFTTFASGFVMILMRGSPLTLPFILSLFILIFARRRSASSLRSVFSMAFMKPLLAITTVFVFLMMILYDWVYLVALYVILPLIFALLLQRAFPKWRSRATKVIMVLTIAIVALITPTPPDVSFNPWRSLVSFSPAIGETESYLPIYSTKASVVQQLIGNETSIENYRLAPADDEVASWLNYKYDVPQTRGYMAQGALQQDWIYWFQAAVFGNPFKGTNEASYAETNFLLDWFGVRWLVIYPGTYIGCPGYNYTKYLQAPSLYRMTASVGEVRGFIYDASPIVSATNAPSVLIIGKDVESYNHIFIGLAYCDYDSRYAIPIRGRQYIDDYSLDELKMYNTIVLYGYGYRDAAKAWQLLQSYVEGGGGLILETGFQYGSPEWNASYIPPPSPVTRTSWIELEDSWDFTYVNHNITKGTDFKLFSAGPWPWGVSISFNETIRPWGRALLWSRGYPMIVAGQFGLGRVVWSGMNLPWHILIHKNQEESALLARVIDHVSKSCVGEEKDVSYVACSTNPERVVISLYSAAKGVLFKEFYYYRWGAYAAYGNLGKRDLPVRIAGPDFMYVPIPLGLTYPIEIVIEYRMTFTEYFSLGASIATLILLGAHVFVPLAFNRLRGLATHPLGRIKKIIDRLRKWWYKEE